MPITFVYWVSTAASRDFIEYGRRGLLAVVDDRLGQASRRSPQSRKSPSSIEPTKVRISLPITSRQASTRSASERDRGQRVGRVLGVPAPPREVVDDGDLVPAGREAHRGRPAEVPVTAQDQDPHDRARVADRSPAIDPAQPAVASTSPACATSSPELTALRAAGLVLAVAVAAFAIWRRRSLRNADVLILLLVALGAGDRRRAPSSSTRCSRRFSFERENGTRIVGVAVFAILVLFAARGAGARPGLADHARALRGARGARLGAVPRPPAIRSASATRSAVLVPAYNEADSIGDGPRPDPGRGLRASRPRSSSSTTARATAPGTIAAEHGAVVARHVINRGGGAALRTGYRLLADSGATIVVTLDADGQHLPVRDGAPRRSRRLAARSRSRTARACSARPSRTTTARELGIVFFNRLVSLITRTKVTDCSNGYRAVRADVLPSSSCARSSSTPPSS